MQKPPHPDIHPISRLQNVSQCGMGLDVRFRCGLLGYLGSRANTGKRIAEIVRSVGDYFAKRGEPLPINHYLL